MPLLPLCLGVGRAGRGSGGDDGGASRGDGGEGLSSAVAARGPFTEQPETQHLRW